MRTDTEITVTNVIEGWSAPGYRDPELHLQTDQGELHVRLTPQAFVALHDILCAQQACIDRGAHQPLDIDRHPYNTRHVVQDRRRIESLIAANQP